MTALLAIKFPVTSTKLFMSGGVPSTYWIPRFNKTVNSKNVIHGIIPGYFLVSFKIIQAMLI